LSFEALGWLRPKGTVELNGQEKQPRETTGTALLFVPQLDVLLSGLHQIDSTLPRWYQGDLASRVQKQAHIFCYFLPKLILGSITVGFLVSHIVGLIIA